MAGAHASRSLGPVAVALAILVVGPAVLTDPMIATLTATPLRRAVSATLLLVVISGLALWFTSRISIRTAAAVEGGED